MPETLRGACLVGQSGGPTAVINASVYGVIRTALSSEYITDIYGANHGIVGVLKDELFDLKQEDPAELKLLMTTPSAELGSCRYKIADFERGEQDLARILEVFKKHNIRYFFYIGGNDSMDTCDKVDRYLQKVGYECRVIGIPKTIDNDLCLTDHCPGYGSAAKFISTEIAEIYKDARVYDTSMITVIEIMGRHAGWLTGAASLASVCGCGPDLIYMPEVAFDMSRFIEQVISVYSIEHKCIVAVSEGIHYANGMFVSEAVTSSTDSFGHSQLGGLAATLANELKKIVNTKVRGIEFSLLQRCGAHIASRTDSQEAYMAGETAVKLALSGESGKMIGFDCSRDNEYVCRAVPVPLTDVANAEKKVPLEWISSDGCGVTSDFIRYALPLICGENEFPTEYGMPRYARLKKVLVK